MNKRICKTLSAFCLTMVVAFGFTIPAFAQGSEQAPAAPAEDSTNDSNVIVEETEPAPALTPDGNAALVDDFGGNKQLITVTTKAGNYFYILIDRANEDKKTAVHFGAPVFPHGNLAFFVAIFSEMTRLSAGVGLHLHSIHPSITRESKWRYIMKKINLRELYPDVYTTDFFVDVTEEVMETIRAAERAEAAYERKMYRYKAQYSLDCENGIENAVLLKPQTPEMVLEEKQFQEQIYAAVMKLPEKQAKRIYARYYLGMTVNEIAEVEGVDPSRVRDSIRRGLKQLGKYF